MIVEERLEAVSDVFKAVSHPLRLEVILTLLERKKLYVLELQALLGVSQSLLSQHLLWLRKARLIKKKRVENKSYYSLTDRGRELAFLTKKLLEGKK